MVPQGRKKSSQRLEGGLGESGRGVEPNQGCEDKQWRKERGKGLSRKTPTSVPSTAAGTEP